MSFLAIRNLPVTLATAAGSFRADGGIDLDVDSGEMVAVVGESSSGKSVALLATSGIPISSPEQGRSARPQASTSGEAAGGRSENKDWGSA